MDLTVSMGIEPLRFDLRKWTADMELGIYAGPIYHTQEKGYRWRAPLSFLTEEKLCHPRRHTTKKLKAGRRQPMEQGRRRG
ncbi:hypothetical protein E2562_015911 [Oryza meyeriana var. granulata]|uniref:Uncharacterized protein n=1 Tax=Oryza meyeriana var. granulata TaxID=110450 RepID=A0A6G1BIX0_9ORYZ|nr:hypothetical protein E2562_002358 [Oryza meyeriana var. granulata]KAF0899254.1 hypothetical protein E2562_015911 [Oryza meyeriana var. granulata]